MKLYLSKLTNKLISTLTILLILITLLSAPILHQTTLDNNTTHFSILTAIRTDIAEKQLLTPYFIIDSIKN